MSCAERIAIVDASARRNSDEVHAHNSFFIHAATLGYGVRPLHKHDVHSRALTEAESESFIQAFKERYTPLVILEDLLNNIESELRTYYGYQGERPEGYVAGDTEKIIVLLKNVLGESFSDEKAFSLNDDNSVRNLNWLSIQEALWKALRDQQYLEFSTDENTLFEALYRQDDPWSLTQNVVLLEALRVPGNLGSSESETRIFEATFRTDENTLLSLLEKEAYQALIHALALDKHLSLLKYVSIENKRAIFKLLFAAPPGDLSSEALLKYLAQIAETFSENPGAKKEFQQEVVRAWLEKAENKKKLFEACTHKKNLGAQGSLLVLLPYLPIEDLDLLLSSLSNPNFLIELVKYVPQLVSYFLEAAIKFEPTFQEQLWTAKNEHGENALMIAIGLQPSLLLFLLKSLAGLPESIRAQVQKAVWTAQNKCGANALMIAASSKPAALEPLLESLAKLPDAIRDQVQESVWRAKTDNGYNVLTLCAAAQPTAVAPLLKALARLSEETQEAVWRAEVDGYHNALVVAAYHQPEAVKPLLDALAMRKLSTQEHLLAYISFFIPKKARKTLVDYRSNFLNAAVAALNEEEPIEASVKHCLKSMSWVVRAQKIAVLDALRELKKNAPNLNHEQSIQQKREALHNPNSALYQALNMKPYIPSFFGSTSPMLVTVQKVSDELPLFCGVYDNSETPGFGT